MSELNPQPLPPRAVNLEEAVEAITRGVLRALESRGLQVQNSGEADIAGGGSQTGISRIRVIAGGIIEPALASFQSIE